ncbi:sulfurtransferase [Psychroserpens sp. MEBiC05023]
MHRDGSFLPLIVSCEWLYNNQNLERLIILDTSVKTEKSSGEDFIPNSRFFDIKGKFSDINAPFPNTIPSQKQFQDEARALGIDMDSLIVVYDDKGMYWSPRVRWLFKAFGFNNVAVLDGGLPKWKQSNYEIVHHLDVVDWWSRGNFIAAYQGGKMSYFDDIIDWSNNEDVIILDARSEDRFNCLAPEPRIGLRSGNIPNSKSLPYTRVLNGYCFKTKDELKNIFKSFEIGDKLLTFTCGSGITACIIALAAEISDYKKMSVYDGSWTEYGTLIP